MLNKPQQKIISATADFVRSMSSGESSGHDWWHIHRVENLAIYLAQKEEAEIFTVRLAALLHDLDDWKFNTKGSRNSENWLRKIGLDEDTLEKTLLIIDQVSFKGAGEDTTPTSLEAMIVQDADRLDALGAVGIARAFAYGGSKHRPMFEPGVQPVMHGSFEEYQKSKSHTINHFYEKLLLLKDRLHTSTAKQIALSRHVFMEEFLKNFFEEWFFLEENSFLKKD